MSAGVRLVLPGGGAASPLTRFVALSFAVHAIVTAIVVLAPRFGPAPSMPESAWAVELVAAAPAPAPAPRPSRPAVTPAPQPRAETPAAEPVVEQPVRPKPREPRRVEVDVPSRRRAATPPPAPARQPDPGEATDDSAASGPAGVGAGDESASVTALEVADFRYAWYRDAVTAALYGNWRKPVLAGSVGPREVRVAFEIARDGSVRGVRVESPSGLPTLDRSALRAVADAAPFPPLPGGWSSSSLPAAFVFRLYPD